MSKLLSEMKNLNKEMTYAGKTPEFTVENINGVNKVVQNLNGMSDFTKKLAEQHAKHIQKSTAPSLDATVMEYKK